MDPTDWMTLLLTVSGAVAVLRRPLPVIRPRRHLRCVEVRLSCPKTAADVDCELLRDGCTGEYARVESCSASGAEGRPACEQDCVSILNLGIPLRPSDAVKKESSPAEEAAGGGEP
jgi:hypothetical protein